MNWRCGFFIATAAVLFASGAAASYLDGNQLYSECSATNINTIRKKTCSQSAFTTSQGVANCVAALQHQMKCTAYIIGVSDAYDWLRGGESGGQGCTPPEVTAGQAEEVVMRFLKEHPEARHENAAGIVMLAIHNAWCPQKPPAPALEYK